MKASAGSLPSGVLSHKFIAPVPYAGAVARQRILERIRQFPHARVILLQGPAGPGKSTALQQLKDAAQGAGELTGWLTMDAGDNDPRRFLLHFQSLVGALSNRPGGEVGRNIEHRDVSFHYRSDWLLDRIARLGRPVALFLDEFQTLTDKTVLGFLASL